MKHILWIQLLFVVGCSSLGHENLKNESLSLSKDKYTANCRVLNVEKQALHNLKPIENTQSFEATIEGVRIGVSMEDPFIVSHSSKNIILRWNYYFLTSNAKFTSYRQERHLQKGQAGYGEFLVAFSHLSEPNYEQHIASFQNKDGKELKLYCMTTVTEGDARKKIILKKRAGKFYRDVVAN
ncbi:MAG: hypothetical protein CL677_06295 [Bdellovibrionaceae bacterium]|nr:hypothetical protein [Pseudobdellovibrionaceae bacterium]|tara:strand:+ start:30366 stop:30911 length:546 start_codon:yes stop_codon:yes gene_type:complete